MTIASETRLPAPAFTDRKASMPAARVESLVVKDFSYFSRKA